MKKIILSLALIMGGHAMASIVEVNNEDRKIFYSPTPTLQLTLIDLGKDGGVLNILFDYVSKNTLAEYNTMKSQFPGYEIEALYAHKSDVPLTLKIPELGITQDFNQSQGQLGPLVTGQISLTSAQVSSMKLRRAEVLDSVHANIQAKVSFQDRKLMEKYQLEPATCSKFSARNVREMIWTLSQMRKPADMNYQQTFESLRNSILETCFTVETRSVNGFGDLLSLSVTVTNPGKPLVGSYYEKKSISRTIIVTPQPELAIP